MNWAIAKLKSNFNYNFNLSWNPNQFFRINHPPTHITGKVVKWNKTSIGDFNYFNWRVRILAKLSLNSISTPAQPQLNLNANYWAWHYAAQACFLCMIQGTRWEWIIQKSKLHFFWWLVGHNVMGKCNQSHFLDFWPSLLWIPANKISFATLRKRVSKEKTG